MNVFDKLNDCILHDVFTSVKSLTIHNIEFLVSRSDDDGIFIKKKKISINKLEFYFFNFKFTYNTEVLTKSNHLFKIYIYILSNVIVIKGLFAGFSLI